MNPTNIVRRSLACAVALAASFGASVAAHAFTLEGERLEIVPELMLRKKTLEALIKSGYPSGPYQLPESLRGWRRELMGQALLDCLAAEGESA